VEKVFDIYTHESRSIIPPRVAVAAAAAAASAVAAVQRRRNLELL
jgi:hypothetical protein